jgi:N-acetylglutamate synthase-like GNAT family acetyltransferase
VDARRDIVVRSTLKPGDCGEIIRMHGVLYARDCGFDETFEAYVAGPLAEFALRRSTRERIWIAEADYGIAGCVAIVASTDDVAQLRWFLVDPRSRGSGLGTSLLADSVAFARSAGYGSIMLWTIDALATAGRLYRAHGFVKVAEVPGRRWGTDVVEERYELLLR